MIRTLFVSLALLSALLAPAPARAVTFAECQAWLCLPGGFPPSECNAAKAAVTRRLAAFQPPLPPWSACAAAFGWDSAVMSYNQDNTDQCRAGDTLTNGTCRGEDADGCRYSYTAQKNVTVQVSVDGSSNFQPNHPHRQTVAAAGTPAVETGSCLPPPPPPGTDRISCPPDHIIWTDGAGVQHCIPNPGFFSVN